MFFFINAGSAQSNTFTVSQGISFTQRTQLSNPAIFTDLSFYHPLEFARATNGYVYMVNGLDAPIKWSGVSQDSILVGNAAPTTAVTLAFNGSGTITGRYRAYVRYVDEDGNVTNFSPASDIVEATSALTVTYSNVPVPESEKIVRKQILRNTSGQFLTFYVDVDTTDVAGTVFTSNLTDVELRTNTAVALFDTTFVLNLANRHGQPPNDKPLIAFHQNRLWMYGEVVYEQGVASVTNGSATVTGTGTSWTAGMVDRNFFVRDAGDTYVISAVNTDTQTLTLTESFLGATNQFAEYKIRPLTTRRNALHYSEPGLFDSWPATQSIAVASSDDIDDDPTGLISAHSYLYIVQRRHIYRLTFLESPSVDGGIFLAARRGCVNNRCMVSVDGFIYSLDDQGIYKFDGSDTTEVISQNIQDIFYFDSDAGELRINWSASTWFHASLDRHDSTIRWFVAFSGDRLPRHAICFNYAVPQWWIEEYPFACGDSTVLKGVSTASIVGSNNKKVFALQTGALDVVDATEGDTRSLITSWTRRSVTLAPSVSLPVSGVVGAPLAIVKGAGKGQVRKIVAVSGRVLTVDSPWTTALDDDDDAELDTVTEVQIGAMPWSWRSGWTEWPIKEQQQARKVAVSFRQTAAANNMDLRVYKEFKRSAEVWQATWPRVNGDSSGVQTRDESTDAVIDTTIPLGYAYLTIDDFDAYDEYREGVVSVELAGFQCSSTFKVFEIDIMGGRQ